MPELPEVETIRRGLEPVVSGKLVSALAARATRLHGRPVTGLEALTGQRITELERRGKYLLWHTAGARERVLLMHLGMSGRVLIDDQAKAAGDPQRLLAADRHTHFVLQLAQGPVIRFRDPRRFGQLALLTLEQLESFPALAALGPDPFSPAFTARYLHERLSACRATVKARLMDQAVVAGLGNIYALEALHLAGIRPSRRANRVGRAAAARLVEAVRSVLAEAIEAGGSTLKDYRHADGSLGYFQHAFRVYGRAGEPCRRSGCDGVVTRRTQGGRASYWCPRCQR